MVLSFLESHRRVVDARGYAAHMALYSLVFLVRLYLPFCRLVSDVLDFLGLSSL